MERIILGNTGLSASNIGLGCWPMGGLASNLGMGIGWDNVNKEDGIKAILLGIKKGVNVFDTADVYGLGESERILGKAVKLANSTLNVKRNEIIIISKVGYFKGCAEHGFDPLHMRHQLEMSLKNLNTDYIDIYFFHHLNFGENNRYLESSIKQMQQFKREGLIKFIGLRGPHKFSLDRKQNKSYDSYDEFYKISELVNPDIISVRYNMLTSKHEDYHRNIFNWAEERGCGVLTYKPLSHGLLTNKYTIEDVPVFSSEDHRSRKPWFSEQGISIINSHLTDLGERLNCKCIRDYVHLALKYSLSCYKSACTLVGFRNESQVEDITSVEGCLKEEELERIRNEFKNVKDELGEFIKFTGG